MSVRFPFARLLLLPAILSPAASAQEAVPPVTLAELKAAAVYVKVGTADGPASGSGFLIKYSAAAIFVVTNEHVVRPKSKDGEPIRTTGIEIVFHSGAAGEKTLPARIVAADETRDLAVLKAAGFAGAPKPLDLSQKTPLSETMPVYVLGFPFGGALAIDKGNPAITVGRASVSSIRLNEKKEPALVQLDGNINPGNSGGPVVDAKGRLVGVAVASIRGSGIGFAIPPAVLQEILTATVGKPAAALRKVEKGRAEIEFELPIRDPIEQLRIKTATVHYGPAKGEAAKPAADGSWPSIGAPSKSALATEAGRAAGVFTVTPAKKAPATYRFQASYTLEGKTKAVTTEPVDLEIDFSKDFVAPVKEPGTTGTEPPVTAAGPPPRRVVGRTVLTGHTDTVRFVRFSPDGKALATGGFDALVKLWDVAAAKEATTLRGHTDKLNGLAFSPDGKSLLTGACDRTARLWDVASGKQAALFQGFGYWVIGVAFSPDGRTMAMTSAEFMGDAGRGVVRLVRRDDGRELVTIRAHSPWAECVEFAPDGKRLITAGLDNTVNIWDLSGKNVAAHIRGPRGYVFSLSCDRAGRLVAVGSRSGSVLLWNLKADRQQLVLQAHRDEVRGLALSPDGRTLATAAGTDRFVRLWDTETGREAATIDAHEGGVWSVAFSPDGRLLASGGNDCKAVIWRLAP